MTLTDPQRKVLRYLERAGFGLVQHDSIRYGVYGSVRSASRVASQRTAVVRMCTTLQERGFLQCIGAAPYGLTELGYAVLRHYPRFDTSVCLDPQGCRHTTSEVGECCECCGTVIRARRRG